MTRVKRGSVASCRRKKHIFKNSAGFRGSSSTLFRTANQRVLKALKESTRDRHKKKRDFRSLWITRINAAVRLSQQETYVSNSFSLPFLHKEAKSDIAERTSRTRELRSISPCSAHSTREASPLTDTTQQLTLQISNNGSSTSIKNNYNTFMYALKKYPLAFNRKVLATLAIKDSQAFQQIQSHVMLKRH